VGTVHTQCPGHPCVSFAYSGLQPDLNRRRNGSGECLSDVKQCNISSSFDIAGDSRELNVTD
jgi:hypothetical protein